MEIKINFLAVLASVAVNFFIGFLWFTPLFGKAYGKEMGFEKMEPRKNEMLKGMVFMIIGNFLFAYVLAHNIAAWNFVPGMKDMGILSNTLMSAVFTWLGFYFPGHLGATVWERKSWKLFFIQGGYSLVSLLVVAFILIVWQ
jgi:MFS family permease